jgi:hypothetical protein
MYKSKNSKKTLFGTYSNTKSDSECLYAEEIITKFLQPFEEDNCAIVEENFLNGTYEQMLLKLKPYVPSNKCAVLSMKAMSVTQRGCYIECDNKNLREQVLRMQSELENCMNNKKSINGMIETSLYVEATLDMRYVIYIQKYGSPKNGIFDPVLLANCI